ncbi:hypothetical protein V5O48_013855 [Marasmius crinis-equi]|uniref:GmrSD restriction endonucleases N-terminal domain-containing protein n=1 Tax=Marasmius crinis-equi TaxID=585013 RepID=A0ABR3EYY4_9AGAR
MLMLQAEWLCEGTIDLETYFSPGVIWTDQKRCDLIESISYNYYISPIVFSVQYHPKTRRPTKRICIDGKEQLISLQRFMNGDIGLCTTLVEDDASGSREWYNARNITGRKEISMQDKYAFEAQQILCVEYDDLTEDQEHAIFASIQNGKDLQPPVQIVQCTQR